MSGFAEVFEMLDVVEECLDRSDWDRLGTIASPVLTLPTDAAAPQIQAVLDAVETTQARLQHRLDSLAEELAAVPAVRRAARAYLHT